MTNRWIYFAVGAILIVITAYYSNFHASAISDNPENWGQAGDYLGGVLNPILSFISLVLIVKSLNLQIAANLRLKDEIQQSRKSESLRAFENKFFKMIEVQSLNFRKFEIDIFSNPKDAVLVGADAVMAIEDAIAKLRSSNLGNAHISLLISSCDNRDQIFGAARTFYVCVNYIMDHLSDSRGFSKDDRANYMRTLFNFTEFALVRLNIISINFMDFQSSQYLRGCAEFSEVMKDLGIDENSY